VVSDVERGFGGGSEGYRRLARDHHPDANPGAEERFKETPEEETGVRREVLLELRPVASRDGWNGEAHRPG
jgi:hypothetical protein